MSMGKQTMKEILDGIETEFFKQLSMMDDDSILNALKDQIRLKYQQAVSKALADYLENKIYIQ